MSDISLPARAASIINPEALERHIREGVKSRQSKGDYTNEDVRFVSKLALPAASGSLKASPEMLERLRRVAQVWDVELRQKNFTSHRPVIGPVIVALKKALFPIIHFFLADSLRQQRDFNASVLRCLVELTGESTEKSDKSEDKSSQGPL